MNKIWVFIIISSIVSLFFLSPDALLSGMILGANKSISLSFELLAIYSVWLGILGIVENTNISKMLSKILSPFIDWLWGKNKLSKEAKNYLSLALSTQLLGIGGASIPLGIKAIEHMDDKSGRVTKPIIMTIVFACSGVQILPTTVMGMMTTAGSTNPAYIILPTIIAGIATTVVGVSLAIICGKIDDWIGLKKAKKHPQKIEPPACNLFSAVKK